MSQQVFKPVNYRQFRAFIAGISACKVKNKSKGYETVIYDNHSQIQAIVHAASIDENGRCYPAEYFVRSQIAAHAMAIAA